MASNEELDEKTKRSGGEVEGGIIRLVSRVHAAFVALIRSTSTKLPAGGVVIRRERGEAGFDCPCMCGLSTYGGRDRVSVELWVYNERRRKEESVAVMVVVGKCTSTWLSYHIRTAVIILPDAPTKRAAPPLFLLRPTLGAIEPINKDGVVLHFR